MRSAERIDALHIAALHRAADVGKRLVDRPIQFGDPGEVV
jgi:hypothetical protein